MSNQRLVVEAAFGFGPFDTVTSTDWVRLIRPDTGATRAMGAQWRIGRDDEFEHFPAGTATVTLWNRDRFLDPDYSTGPYFGDLLPMVPVRVRSQNVDTGTLQDEFYGYVQGGWEQVLTEQGTLTCRLELVDLLGVISGHRLQDVFDRAVLAVSPVGYWVFDQVDAERVADLSGNGNDGMVGGTGGVEFGDRVLVPGHRPAARFDVDVDAGSDKDVYGYVSMGRSPLVPITGDFTVIATFQARSKASLNWRVLVNQANGDQPARGFQLVVEDTGIVRWTYRTGSVSSATDSVASVVDGEPHLVFALRSGSLYVDGVLSTSGTLGPVGGINGFAVGGGRGIQNVDHFDGWIGLVALYDVNLTVFQLAVIDAAYDKLNGLRTDEQIGWALDAVGVPAGLRNLDAGTVFMGPADTGGRDALEWMRDVTATEGGGLFVDHRDGGKVRFTNRYSRSLATRSVTAQAAFTDDPASTGIWYSPDGLDIAPNGLNGIVNQATVRWRDGEVTVSDAASIAAYGARERTIDTDGTTPGHARSVGEWVVAQNSQPRSRVRGCVAAARTFGARHDDVHDLRIGDKVTFRVLPLGVGAATTVTLFVDGIDHSADGVEWQTAFRFAQDQTFTPWLWGTGLWGTTTLWG